MSIRSKILCISLAIYLFTQIGTYTVSQGDLKKATKEQNSNKQDLSKRDKIKQELKGEDSNEQELSKKNLAEGKGKDYPNEKRASPAYDTIIREDGLPHYRVLFWVPKKASKFIPCADDGVETDVSEHGPVEKWAVEEAKVTNDKEKLVYILVPKTFVFLYGNGFEKVIHLRYS